MICSQRLQYTSTESLTGKILHHIFLDGKGLLAPCRDCCHRRQAVCMSQSVLFSTFADIHNGLLQPPQSLLALLGSTDGF